MQILHARCVFSAGTFIPKRNLSLGDTSEESKEESSNRWETAKLGQNPDADLVCVGFFQLGRRCVEGAYKKPPR